MRPTGLKAEGQWREAIRRAAFEYGTDTDGRKRRHITILARRLVGWALDGQPWAVQEVGNRLDGRPAQAITGAGGGPIQIEALAVPELARRLAWLYAEALRQGGETLDLVPEPSGLLSSDMQSADEDDKA